MRTLVYNSTRVCNKTTVIQNESTDSCKHFYSLTILAIDKASVAFHQVCPLRESNKSLHDKQGCTTVSANTEVQYCNRMNWQQKRTQHTTQHEPFLPSKLFQTDNTGLTPCSGFTSDKNEYQKQVWTAQTSEWQGFTMLYPREVIAWLHQLCAIKFTKTTCKSKWVPEQIKDCVPNRMISKHVIYHTRNT